VTTIPPLGMMLRPVAGERAEVDVLLGPGDSPHTYDPRPSDVQSAEGSLLLAYAHPHLDGWAASLPAPRRLQLVPLVPEGFQLDMPEGHHEAEHARGEHASDRHGVRDVDPHVWGDPKAVIALLPALSDTLCSVDPEGCSVYRANADTFSTDLAALDARLQAMLRPVEGRRAMLSQPFFRYFLRRYGVELVSTVEPLPAKEPSPRQIQSLAEQAAASGVDVIFTQAQLPDRAARVVAETAGVPVHALDPIGGVDGRRTYEDLLLYNAQEVMGALRARGE
jgi:zinc transport system substrate-binding protein